MGEGGAAPVHAISAGLHDALRALHIPITDSFNDGDTIYRSMQQAQAGTNRAAVRLER